MALGDVQEFRVENPAVSGRRTTFQFPVKLRRRAVERGVPERSWGRMHRYGAPVLDGLLVFAITALTVPLTPLPLEDALAVALLTGAASVGCIGLLRGYDPRRAACGTTEYTAILKAAWVCLFALMTLSYLDVLPARGVHVLVAAGLAGGALLLNRWLQRHLIRRARRRGRWQRRTLLLGSPEQLQRITEEFAARPRDGFEVVGACLPTATEGFTGARVFGDLTKAAEVIAEQNIRVVIVAASCMDAAQLRRFCWRIAAQDVELLIAPDVTDVAPVRMALRSLPGAPMVAMTIRPSRSQRLAKGALDRTLGTMLFLAALPVLVTSMVFIRAGSTGPALYRQTRLGRDGREFTMLKLRTMYTDADRRRSELLDHSDGNDLMFKMRSDPRVTAAGKVLRRFSVDELPQLWNVVRGDMSLVGPRPPLVEEVAQYGPDALQRLRVKPGLTGLWQVSGRSDLDWAQTVRLDLKYVDNWSVLMDLTILCRTFGAVLGGRGAY